MPSGKDVTRYKHAQRLAYQHQSYGKFRMVCTAYRGKSLIYVGKNYYPSRRSGVNTNKLYEGIGLHAELDVLSSLYQQHTSSVNLYIAGFNHNNNHIASRPCPRCSLLLFNCDSVKHIIYWDGKSLTKVSRSDIELLPIPPFNKKEKHDCIKEPYTRAV
jgi:cytidine deaminase